MSTTVSIPYWHVIFYFYVKYPCAIREALATFTVKHLSTKYRGEKSFTFYLQYGKRNSKHHNMERLIDKHLEYSKMLGPNEYFLVDSWSFRRINPMYQDVLSHSRIISQVAVRGGLWTSEAGLGRATVLQECITPFFQTGGTIT